jgi:hypothetical protein
MKVPALPVCTIIALAILLALVTPSLVDGPVRPLTHAASWLPDLLLVAVGVVLGFLWGTETAERRLSGVQEAQANLADAILRKARRDMVRDESE